MKFSAPLRVRNGCPKRPRVSAHGFKALIAYDDVAAARDAMSVINGVLRAAPRPHRLEPMLWRYDQLAAAKWRAPSLADAANAEVVVLASATAGTLPSEVEAWVTQLLARKSGSRLTVVALLGANDAWTISIDVPAALRELACPEAPPPVLEQAHAA